MIILYELVDFIEVTRIKMFALYVGLRKFLILRQDSFGSVSKLIELQDFFKPACVSTLIVIFNLFLQLQLGP